MDVNKVSATLARECTRQGLRFGKPPQSVLRALSGPGRSDELDDRLNAVATENPVT